MKCKKDGFYIVHGHIFCLSTTVTFSVNDMFLKIKIENMQEGLADERCLERKETYSIRESQGQVLLVMVEICLYPAEHLWFRRGYIR